MAAGLHQQKRKSSRDFYEIASVSSVFLPMNGEVMAPGW
jgi:hypothetical protein